MTFLATILLVSASGLGLLDLLRLRTGHWLADAGFSWLVGCGWYAWAAMVLRIGLGIPYCTATALVIALLPGAAALARRRLSPAPPPNKDAVNAIASEGCVCWVDRVARWLPRPWKFWLPVALYVIAVTTTIALHGINTPTHTDDATRVRAFTPFLAVDDDWSPVAKNLLIAAGALPTFVPTVAWKLTGRLDHFHINYTVLTHLAAFLSLALGLAVRAKLPQRGWATAFAVLSLPFLVYHLTSTYQDAVVALFAGAVLLFVLDYARSGDGADTARAFLLAAVVAMVKRDGAVVGGGLSAVVLAHLLWRRRRERIPVLVPALHAFAPAAVYLALAIAAAGRAWAAPIVDQAIARLEPTTTSAGLSTSGVPWMAAKTYGEALWQRGNAGMLYWVLPLAAVTQWHRLIRRALALPLVAALVVFAETTVSSIWLIPGFTIDQSTVHRALLAPSILLAVWLAALLTDTTRDAQNPLVPDPSERKDAEAIS